MRIDVVTEILREAAEAAILPRYRSLADGEEATTANLGLLLALREAPAVWLVDPLDGTANFVAGRPEYAVMAALVRHGRTVASWIVQPARGRTYTAEKGSGAWRDGTRIHRAPAPADSAALRGAALTRFLDAPARARVRAAASRFAALGPGTKCAGVDYPRLAEGGQDFVLYHRTLPWDHAPGALLLTEAAGVVRRHDRSPYRPDDARSGLLAAADPRCWRTVRSILAARA
ncbi:inositol monophosphatase family protein [Streptomyces sp. NPDC002994]|uniref:inositol monophosphatase family protein n=1 Tax=Streptomyces sp. NPDC002994 TaxID=3154441 RepID=UPI0033B74D4B